MRSDALRSLSSEQSSLQRLRPPSTVRQRAYHDHSTVPLPLARVCRTGIDFNGSSLRVRRPNDYNPAAVPPFTNPVKLDMSKLGVATFSTSVPDGPGKASCSPCRA